MGAIGPGIIAAVSSVILLAIVAVVVSKNAQTPQVIQSGGSALASVIGAAVAPVTGTTNAFGGAAGGALGGMF
jgi:PRD1 phage membrane DNA delivery